MTDAALNNHDSGLPGDVRDRYRQRGDDKPRPQTKISLQPKTRCIDNQSSYLRSNSTTDNVPDDLPFANARNVFHHFLLRTFSLFKSEEETLDDPPDTDDQPDSDDPPDSNEEINDPVLELPRPQDPPRQVESKSIKEDKTNIIKKQDNDESFEIVDASVECLKVQNLPLNASEEYLKVQKLPLNASEECLKVQNLPGIICNAEVDSEDCEKKESSSDGESSLNSPDIASSSSDESLIDEHPQHGKCGRQTTSSPPAALHLTTADEVWLVVDPIATNEATDTTSTDCIRQIVSTCQEQQEQESEQQEQESEQQEQELEPQQSVTDTTFTPRSKQEFNLKPRQDDSPGNTEHGLPVCPRKVRRKKRQDITSLTKRAEQNCSLREVPKDLFPVKPVLHRRSRQRKHAQKNNDHIDRLVIRDGRDSTDSFVANNTSSVDDLFIESFHDSVSDETFSHRLRHLGVSADVNQTDSFKLSRKRFAIPSQIYTISEERAVSNNPDSHPPHSSSGPESAIDPSEPSTSVSQAIIRREPSNISVKSRRKSLYDTPHIFEEFVFDPDCVSIVTENIEGTLVEPLPVGVADDFQSNGSVLNTTLSDADSDSSSNSSDSSDSDIFDNKPRFTRFSPSRSTIRRTSIDLADITNANATYPQNRKARPRRNSVGCFQSGNHQAPPRRMLSKSLSMRHRDSTEASESGPLTMMAAPDEPDARMSPQPTRKAPMMGTASLMGRQQTYLQAYMEKYGRRRSQPSDGLNDADVKFALSKETISRYARSETLAKYIRTRLENTPGASVERRASERRERRCPSDMTGGNDVRLGHESRKHKNLITSTSGGARIGAQSSQSFNEGRELGSDRCLKRTGKNLRSATDPGFLSDSSELSSGCQISPAASVSSVDSPSQSRHNSLGSNSSLSKFFKKASFRARFHIPTLDDLKKKKKTGSVTPVTKPDMQADLYKRRSFQFDSIQQERHTSQRVQKTRSTGGLDNDSQYELNFSNFGYGATASIGDVEDHCTHRRQHSLNRNFTNRISVYDNVHEMEYLPDPGQIDQFHKAASYNMIPDRGLVDEGMNRVQSDSSLMFSMTHALPTQWVSNDRTNSALFYDSSDTESACDDPYRHRDRSAQSLDAEWSGIDDRRSRVPNRMCQSFTEKSRERLSTSIWMHEREEDHFDPGEELVNVTKDIYSHFPSANEKQCNSRRNLLSVHSVSMDRGADDALSARERRRQLKQASRSSRSQPDTLPRLERSKTTATCPISPTHLSTSHSLPNSRPGSQPNSRPGSRSQSPQPSTIPGPPWMTQTTGGQYHHDGGGHYHHEGAGHYHPEGHRQRRRLCSDEAAGSIQACISLTRARSLPGYDGLQMSPNDDDYGMTSQDGCNVITGSNLLEVPAYHDCYGDQKTGQVVRSSSDVVSMRIDEERRVGRRKPRLYKSDPFTEFGTDGRPIQIYHSLKDKLLSQSTLPFTESLPRMPVRRVSADEVTSVHSLEEIRGSQDDDSDPQAGYDGDSSSSGGSRKHKASICDDCEAAFTLTKSLREDDDHLCKQCENKRTERRKAILEIVNTEISYGRDLGLIKEEFYLPMQSNSLLSTEQVTQIFLNLQELIDVNARFSKSLQQAINNALQNMDDNFNTIHIGKFFLENRFMFLAFENYCVKHTQALMLLERLEKEKELLRIFLEVSQTDNHLLRRMNLKSFLMIPVQRVFKYPLLLSRLYQATPSHHKDLQTIKDAQHKIEEILTHINASTKTSTLGNVSRLKTKGSINRKPYTEDIEIQRVAFSLLGKQHNEAVVAHMGRLQCAQPTELTHWNKRPKGLKFTTVHGLVLSSAHVLIPATYEEDVLFPRKGAVTEASLVLLREKNSKYVPLRENLSLSKCVVSCELDNYELIIEVQEMNKDAIFFKADNLTDTSNWLRTLRYQSKDVGSWRRRRNALANIMISKPAS